MTTTIRDIPEDAHRDLRVWCIQNGVSLNKALVQLIVDRVEEIRRGEPTRTAKGLDFGTVTPTPRK